MNIALLRQIQAHIREEPMRLWMDEWGMRGKPGGDECCDGQISPVPFPACGTIACIAGWAVELSGEYAVPHSGIHGAAERLLGYDYDWDLVFFVENWPDDLKLRYREAEGRNDRVEMVEATCKVIDRFIEEHGVRA